MEDLPGSGEHDGDTADGADEHPGGADKPPKPEDPSAAGGIEGFLDEGRGLPGGVERPLGGGAEGPLGGGGGGALDGGGGPLCGGGGGPVDGGGGGPLGGGGGFGEEDV